MHRPHSIRVAFSDQFFSLVWLMCLCLCFFSSSVFAAACVLLRFFFCFCWHLVRCSDELWKQFLANSNANIHFVLLMKPNDAFRLCCRRYPGLIGNTSIDYMRSWGEQVLIKVANVFLDGHPLIAENHLNGIVEHVVYVHQSVHNYSVRFLAECDRLNVVTPKHYLEYIHTHIRLMGKNERMHEWMHKCLIFCSYFSCIWSLFLCFMWIVILLVVPLLIGSRARFTFALFFCVLFFRDEFLEEKNRFLAERCNRFLNAISKCDELSEIRNTLSTLAQEQRESMQLFKIKCKEMVDNIEKSKCALLFLLC